MTATLDSQGLDDLDSETIAVALLLLYVIRQRFVRTFRAGTTGGDLVQHLERAGLLTLDRHDVCGFELLEVR